MLAPITPLAQRQPIEPPQPLTRFVGREVEVAAACALLRRNDVRLVTLTGPGGIGKTRLGLAVAANLRGHFEGGIAWVPLAAIRDPALVLPAIAQSLGIAASHPASLVDHILSAVHDRRLLLIDNVEQVVAAAPDIAGILAACPTLTVLATSREPLRISGERVLQVSPLTLPDPSDAGTVERLVESEAVRLFADRAEAAASTFELDAASAPVVAEICTRLHGLPLAIELAAARVYHLSLDSLLARLESRLPLLTGGPRDVPERHRTMHDAITWSYDLLSPEQQALFRQLAVFIGGFTLEAVENIRGDGGTVLDDLRALVDKSLVQHGPDARGGSRYAQLELVKEYAAERLAMAGEEAAVRRRHAAFFLELPGAARRELTADAVAAWA
ncbi:MAG: hypothetical protein H0T72_03110, partial [Chloroflexia bacterium]|nr:hypothetical protein [Chloroflexia bacterium]